MGDGNEKMTEAALAAKEESAVALYGDGPVVDGLDTLDDSDFVVPFVRLTQALSDDVTEGDAKPGEFRNSMTGELYEQPLEFVILRVGVRRDYYNDERKRVCFSPDGKVGIGTPGGDCATCELSKWGRDRGADDPNEPPECDRGIEYIALVMGRDDALPVAITLSSTNTSEARKVNSILKTMRTPHVFEARAIAKTAPKGKYFGWEIRRGRQLTPDEARDYIDMRRMLAGVNIVVDRPDTDERAGGGSEDGEPF